MVPWTPSRDVTHGLSFQQFHGELEAALQLNNEAEIVSLRDRASQVYCHKAHDELALYYTLHERYVRLRKYEKSSSI